MQFFGGLKAFGLNKAKEVLFEYRDTVGKLLKEVEWLDIFNARVTISEDHANKYWKPIMLRQAEGYIQDLSISFAGQHINIDSQGKVNGVSFNACHVVEVEQFSFGPEGAFLTLKLVDERIGGSKVMDKVLLGLAKAIYYSLFNKKFIEKFVDGRPDITLKHDKITVNLGDIIARSEMASGLKLDRMFSLAYEGIIDSAMVFTITPNLPPGITEFVREEQGEN